MKKRKKLLGTMLAVSLLFAQTAVVNAESIEEANAVNPLDIGQFSTQLESVHLETLNSDIVDDEIQIESCRLISNSRNYIPRRVLSDTIMPSVSF
ncbi:MAG: hypothetical protein HDR01_02195 [Lachnospiraceae bacterium]|nr:hypothetical protein [Lachnospiraceae bacterium]